MSGAVAVVHDDTGGRGVGAEASEQEGHRRGGEAERRDAERFMSCLLRGQARRRAMAATPARPASSSAVDVGSGTGAVVRVSCRSSTSTAFGRPSSSGPTAVPISRNSAVVPAGDGRGLEAHQAPARRVDQALELLLQRQQIAVAAEVLQLHEGIACRARIPFGPEAQPRAVADVGRAQRRQAAWPTESCKAMDASKPFGASTAASSCRSARRWSDWRGWTWPR